MPSKKQDQKPRGSDRRAVERRRAEQAFPGDDRRSAERRSGDDRRGAK